MVLTGDCGGDGVVVDGSGGYGVGGGKEGRNFMSENLYGKRI